MRRRELLVGLAMAALWTGAARAEQPIVRVLTYNIHHGEGTDGKLGLPRIAAVIQSARPDLVALQEVDVKTRRAAGVDQAAELARLTGMRAVFSQAIPYDAGQYGDAVLLRWPVLEERRVTLPAPQGFELRTVVAVRVRPAGAGEDVWFASTHLDHLADEVRLCQAGKIVAGLATLRGRAMILAGDLNALAGSPAMTLLGRTWSDATAAKAQPTWPADAPTKKIDYVLVRPDGAWKVLESKVLEEPVASDHRPLLVQLELQ